MSFLIRLFVIAFVFLATAYLLPKIHVENFWIILPAAIVLSIINLTIASALLVPSLTIGALAFRLLAILAANVAMILLMPVIIPGFVIDSFWQAMFLAWIITLIKICIP